MGRSIGEFLAKYRLFYTKLSQKLAADIDCKNIRTNPLDKVKKERILISESEKERKQGRPK